MESPFREFLNKRLRERENQGLIRKLHSPNVLVDFSSNDYLGFARSSGLRDFTLSELSTANCPLPTFFGSTGSRLLTGNSQYTEDLEKFIAEYHKAEAGLIFNSGYAANSGLISSVAWKEDVIFYDELSHASIYDGVRLSKAASFSFRHNDLTHLEDRLKFFRKDFKVSKNLKGLDRKDAALDFKSRPTAFVIVESVYSMDGDFAPLQEITSLCETYNVNLIVDEAHATGIFSAKGEGRVVELGLEQRVFARVHTFGKALGCHGAIVLGSDELRNYLINFSRPFIYTTALPFHSLAAIKAAYNYLGFSKDRSNGMVEEWKNDKQPSIPTFHHSNPPVLINFFVAKVKDKSISGFLRSFSPIQSLIVKGNERVKKISSLVQKDGYDVRPILSPTVAKGKERIRICLHAFNTEEEINGLLVSLKKNSNK